MNLLDAVILLLLLLQAVKWARLGFFMGVFSLGGAWTGLIIGILISPYLISGVADSVTRLMIVLFVVTTLSVVLATGGQYIGSHLANLSKKINLGHLDSVMGAAFSAFVTLGIVWLSASVFSGTSIPSLNNQIRGSTIISNLNQSLPPAPALLSRLSHYLDTSIFPRVFTGPEPFAESIDEPPTEEMQQAVAATQGSIIRIESAGCGGFVTGSGFVADDNLIITNAHVVAGVSSITTVNEQGRQRAGVVLFDPDMDIAILRVNRPQGTPLPMLNETLGRGQTGTTLGYPGGGELEASSAVILRQMTARGLDIYGQDSSMREIYQLQTHVIEGNSGGPVVRPGGTVIGVIFARSDGQENVGYALTSASVIPLLQQAQQTNGFVANGVCAPA